MGCDVLDGTGAFAPDGTPEDYFYRPPADLRHLRHRAVPLLGTYRRQEARTEGMRILAIGRAPSSGKTPQRGGMSRLGSNPVARLLTRCPDQNAYPNRDSHGLRGTFPSYWLFGCVGYNPSPRGRGRGSPPPGSPAALGCTAARKPEPKECEHPPSDVLQQAVKRHNAGVCPVWGRTQWPVFLQDAPPKTPTPIGTASASEEPFHRIGWLDVWVTIHPHGGVDEAVPLLGTYRRQEARTERMRTPAIGRAWTSGKTPQRGSMSRSGSNPIARSLTRYLALNAYPNRDSHGLRRTFPLNWLVGWMCGLQSIPTGAWPRQSPFLGRTAARKPRPKECEQPPSDVLQQAVKRHSAGVCPDWGRTQ